MMTSDNPVIARVCKHANYSVNRRDPLKDLLCAKLTLIYADGRRENKFISIEDYKQPFYVVKEKYRKFKQPKDYIDKRMCKEFSSSRARLAYNISKTLNGIPDPRAELRQMKGSPYVFGCEQTTPVVFKQLYFDRYPQYQETEPYTMAAYDVETDMFSERQEVMMASVTFKDKAYFAARRGWYEEPDDETILRKLKEAETTHLKEILDERGCTVQYELFDNEGEVVAACVGKFHEWQPDWITSWNATYDMEKNEEALLFNHIDPAKVYCDPSIPDEYKYYKLDKGRTHKEKENGDKQSLESQEKFPTVRTMASWQWADAMSFYAIKRAPKGKLDSYKLEAIAQKEKVPGKMHPTEGSEYPPNTPEWHKHMQRYHKYIYSMYNINDNFVIEDINNKTDDFTYSLPMLIKSSEYFNYPSQPRVISDALSFIALKNGYVWGCVSGRKGNPYEDMLPDLRDWIALLETEKNADFGRVLFEGLNDVISRARGITDDIDVTGAYPTGTVALNISNKTTRMEVVKIQGADRMKFREIAVNYASSPEANAIGLCNSLFRFPQADTVTSVFEEKLKEMGKEHVVQSLRRAPGKEDVPSVLLDKVM